MNGSSGLASASCKILTDRLSDRSFSLTASRTERATAHILESRQRPRGYCGLSLVRAVRHSLVHLLRKLILKALRLTGHSVKRRAQIVFVISVTLHITTYSIGAGG